MQHVTIYHNHSIDSYSISQNLADCDAAVLIRDLDIGSLLTLLCEHLLSWFYHGDL